MNAFAIATVGMVVPLTVLVAVSVAMILVAARQSARDAVLTWRSVDVTVPLTSLGLQVNKIREVPQQPSLVVTHTDAPELYLWNMDTQPSIP